MPLLLRTTRLPFLVLFTLPIACALPPSSPPSTFGSFNSWTNALPHAQLPHVPMTGNGALGVLVDGKNDQAPCLGGCVDGSAPARSGAAVSVTRSQTAAAGSPRSAG